MVFHADSVISHSECIATTTTITDPHEFAACTVTVHSDVVISH